MKLLKKTDARVFTNGPTCEGVEYSFEDKDLNIALVTVNGRYPEAGYAMNEVCKEAAYILRGSGKLCLAGGEEVLVAPGDSVLLQPGEKYYWEGENLEMIMPCSPAFYPEQHKKS